MTIKPGIGEWATSNDPILQRYGVGALARTAISSPPAFAAVKNAGGVKKLVAALNSNDPQAQCFAAGTVGNTHSLFNQIPFNLQDVDWTMTMLFMVFREVDQH